MTAVAVIGLGAAMVVQIRQSPAQRGWAAE